MLTDTTYPIIITDHLVKSVNFYEDHHTTGLCIRTH